MKKEEDRVIDSEYNCTPCSYLITTKVKLMYKVK